jgi:erythromycin esterase-like protein
MPDARILAAVRAAAQPIVGALDDYDRMIADLAQARFVLLGESSHGTHEFYRERARITRRLLTRHGFAGVAVEADWPEALRVHHFVTDRSDDPDAVDALGDFQRFPAWMWRNADVLDFVGWQRELGARQSTGFWGLDLYSLHRSAAAVIAWLERVDPMTAWRARELYACLDQAAADPQRYGLGVALGLSPSCEDGVVRMLEELRTRRSRWVERGGEDVASEFFQAEQNARVARDAEAWYRGLFRRRVNTWNLRDQHMADTLEALAIHVSARLGRASKLVVWAHDSHVCDGRASDFGRRGDVTLGQLARERWGDQVRLVGFSTYAGSVTAASSWGGPAERKRVRHARPDSWEALLHAVGLPRFWFATRGLGLDAELLRRAIGVLYLPDTELQSHYYTARLGEQADYVLHFGLTRAVEPLERTSKWEAGELPETFPSMV